MKTDAKTPTCTSPSTVITSSTNSTGMITTNPKDVAKLFHSLFCVEPPPPTEQEVLSFMLSQISEEACSTPQRSTQHISTVMATLEELYYGALKEVPTVFGGVEVICLPAGGYHGEVVYSMGGTPYTISQLPHPHFERRGDDLVCTQKIHDTCKHVSGRVISFPSPPPTSPLLLRGEGMPRRYSPMRRGDMLVVFDTDRKRSASDVDDSQECQVKRGRRQLLLKA